METATTVKLDLKGSPDEVFLCFENEYFNSSQANVPFLHPLKTSGNLWFSDVFRGYRKGILA